VSWGEFATFVAGLFFAAVLMATWYETFVMPKLRHELAMAWREKISERAGT